MIFIDNDGAWIQAADGVLEAEKNDNAWTLASYLNTSPEIAIMLLSEQGYSINKNGILNLRVGDPFYYDTYTTTMTETMSLGPVGNMIRSFLSSDFSKTLFENYWLGKGDIKLSGKEFAGVLMYLKQPGTYVRNGDALLIGESGRSYSGAIATANFYSSENYALAFGTAEVFLNKRGHIVGFYDEYNFNALPWGVRSVKNEIKTRLVKAASPRKSKDFFIRYGYETK